MALKHRWTPSWSPSLFPPSSPYDGLAGSRISCVLSSAVPKAPFGWENLLVSGKMGLMKLYRYRLKLSNGGSTSAIIPFLKHIVEEYLGKAQEALEHLKVIIKWILFALEGF